MKVLVFEFISGGGFCRQDLPVALANEGKIMLDTLLHDLLDLKHIQLCVPLDWRLFDANVLPVEENLQLIKITNKDVIDAVLTRLIPICDACWPIAPESEGILAGICQRVIDNGKILLTSSVSACKLSADKYQTFTHLSEYGIAMLPSQLLLTRFGYQSGVWVIKPRDGVGCEGLRLIETEQDYQQFKIEHSDPSNYIIQPYFKGKTLSLSCLFKQGKGWLLSCNEQCITMLGQRFKLTACVVNVTAEQPDTYQPLVEKIAQAIPGLWGYAGIDLLVNRQGIWVVEINPRLTTSYAGIHAALGINVAESVLSLLHSEPLIKINRNKQIRVDISEE